MEWHGNEMGITCNSHILQKKPSESLFFSHFFFPNNLPNVKATADFSLVLIVQKLFCVSHYGSHDLFSLIFS